MAINQLMLSKYLFQCGQSELGKNTPVSCGLVISLFQDSVELLIRGVGKEYDAKITDHTSFGQLWEAIENARRNSEKIALPLQAKMLELNKARANFKHHGILPDVSEGRKFSTYMEDFLRETTETFLKQDFGQISLADLIHNSKIREVIKEAQKFLNEGDFEKCMTACAKADQIASGTVRTIAPELPRAFMDFSRLFDREKSNSAHAWVQTLDAYLRGLRHFSIAIVLKIKLPDYVRFHAVVPDAVYCGKDTWQFNIRGTASKADADFCLNYVTSYALAVQEQFADLIKPSTTEA